MKGPSPLLHPAAKRQESQIMVVTDDTQVANWICLTSDHACTSPFNPRQLGGRISQTEKAVSIAGPGQDRNEPLGVTSEPPTGLNHRTQPCQHTCYSSSRNPNQPLASALGNHRDRSLCAQAQAVWHCQRREGGHAPEGGGYVTS